MAEQTESQVKAVDTVCFRLPDEGVLDVLRRKYQAKSCALYLKAAEDKERGSLIIATADYYKNAALRIEALMGEPVVAVIGQYHDYIAMNANECIFDPTPEESARILAESAITILKDEAPKGQEGL